MEKEVRVSICRKLRRIQHELGSMIEVLQKDNDREKQELIDENLSLKCKNEGLECLIEYLQPE